MRKRESQRDDHGAVARAGGGAAFSRLSKGGRGIGAGSIYWARCLLGQRKEKKKVEIYLKSDFQL
jgi:hypothetical protein